MILVAISVYVAIGRKFLLRYRICLYILLNFNQVWLFCRSLRVFSDNNEADNPEKEVEVRNISYIFWMIKNDTLSAVSVHIDTAGAGTFVVCVMDWYSS